MRNLECAPKSLYWADMAGREQSEQTDCVEVRFFAPPDDLAPCFTTFYRCRIRAPDGGRIVDYLQPEWSNLRFFTGSLPRVRSSRDGTIIEGRFQATGPSSRPVYFEVGSTDLWGIGLLPLGWARFVNVSAQNYCDTVVDGERDEVFSRFAPLGEMLRESTASDEKQFELITDFFRNLAPPPRDAPRILRVHEAMLDPYLVDVGKLAEHVGLTKRTLERTCGRHFGFPPRLLLRRQRMMRSLAAFMLSEGKSWTETIDRHYHDQAHFVHEFHAFMGMSPSEYAAMDHPIIDAFIANRQRVWGSPVQTLDIPRGLPADDDES